MTLVRQTVPVAYRRSSQEGGARQSTRWKARLQALFETLPDNIGEVPEGSLEEQIWRQLGALPLSRRRK